TGRGKMRLGEICVITDCQRAIDILVGLAKRRLCRGIVVQYIRQRALDLRVNVELQYVRSKSCVGTRRADQLAKLLSLHGDDPPFIVPVYRTVVSERVRTSVEQGEDTLYESEVRKLGRSIREFMLTASALKMLRGLEGCRNLWGFISGQSRLRYCLSRIDGGSDECPNCDAQVTEDGETVTRSRDLAMVL
ncbi:hypothetical protein FOZ62_009787, partial [Perkinsus olseni]